MDVEHGRLQLCELNGGDAHRPDVTQFIVAAFNLHSCYLGRHPVDRGGDSKDGDKNHLKEGDIFETFLSKKWLKCRKLDTQLESSVDLNSREREVRSYQYGVPMKDILRARVAVI